MLRPLDPILPVSHVAGGQGQAGNKNALKTMEWSEIDSGSL
jgi:hypothetical protein